MKSLVVYLRTESALTASQNYVKFYYMVRNLKCLKSIPTTNSFSWVCKSLFTLYIGITLLMTHMTSDLVSKIFLTLVSKILFIFVILYRPTLLTRRFDILTMLTGNLIPFYAAYLSFFNTGWLRTLSFCLYSHWAMKWTGWMCGVLFFSLYIYFLDLSISFIAHFSFISNDIMSIMFSQSPTPKFHNNIICHHIECLCHQLYLQFQEMYAVIPIFHFILLYFLNLIYS